MCEALRELMREEMKEEFDLVEARGVAIGEAKGEIIGAIKTYHEELNLMPVEIIKKIMVRFGLEKAVAEKYVEETLGLQLV